MCVPPYMAMAEINEQMAAVAREEEDITLWTSWRWFSGVIFGVPAWIAWALWMFGILDGDAVPVGFLLMVLGGLMIAAIFVYPDTPLAIARTMRAPRVMAWCGTVAIVVIVALATALVHARARFSALDVVGERAALAADAATLRDVLHKVCVMDKPWYHMHSVAREMYKRYK